MPTMCSKILLCNPTTVAVLQGRGTKTLVMYKTSQWNNFLVSLPFKDYHDCPFPIHRTTFTCGVFSLFFVFVSFGRASRLAES